MLSTKLLPSGRINTPTHTPHGSSLRRDEVGWCRGPYMQPKAWVILIPRRHNPLPHRVESISLAGAGGR